MLVIRADLVEQMVAHARRDHPREACGLVLGPEGSDRPERYVAMTNADTADAQGSDFAFDSGEHLRVHREAEERDEAVVVVFHSHTRVPRRPMTESGLPEAFPSEKDIDFMEWHPGEHFVIVALTGPDTGPEVRSYLLGDGRTVVEDEVRIVERYMLAHTGADDVPDGPERA